MLPKLLKLLICWVTSGLFGETTLPEPMFRYLWRSWVYKPDWLWSLQRSSTEFVWMFPKSKDWTLFLSFLKVCVSSKLTGEFLLFSVCLCVPILSCWVSKNFCSSGLRCKQFSLNRSESRPRWLLLILLMLVHMSFILAYRSNGSTISFDCFTSLL